MPSPPDQVRGRLWPSPAERARGPSVASNVPALKGDHAACFSFFWVPASAGMTVMYAGLTLALAGMTGVSAGMT